MPITPEQLCTTLENMKQAWEAKPESERLPKDEEKSFFEGDLLTVCYEMLDRWHSGSSSHPDKAILSAEYPNNKEGALQLRKDLMDIKNDPFVQAADLELRLVKHK